MGTLVAAARAAGADAEASVPDPDGASLLGGTPGT